MTSLISSSHLKLKLKKVFPKQKLSIMFEEPFPRKKLCTRLDKAGVFNGLLLAV